MSNSANSVIGRLVKKDLNITIAGLAVVLLLSFFTYYRHYDEPNYVFWDENYHITAAERYLENIAQFEGHPPLGKLLIAAGEYIAGTNAQVDKQILTHFKYIGGDLLPKRFSFAGMRLMPSLFGMLTAVLVYGFFLSLTGYKPVMSLLFSGLYLFENVYIVHFRAVHLDSFQMFFTVATLWLFVELWKRPVQLHWKHYAAMGMLSAMAMMVKINAVLLLALLPVLYLKEARFVQRGLRESLADFIGKMAATLFGIVIICVAVFSIHLLAGRNLPDIKTPAGSEDIAHMSPAYRHFLEFHENITPALFVMAAQDYYTFMRKSHLGVPKLDVCKVGENGSSPIRWTIMDKTINYRWDSKNGKTRYIQLAGNPLSWYLGLMALMMSFGLIIGHRIFAAPVYSFAIYQQIEVFTGLYIIYMGLHLYLASLRVMYLYHYFFGLFISYILVVLVWQYLEEVHDILRRRRYFILGGLMLAVFASYLFISPLTYHQPLTKQECEQRNLFKQVVDCR